MSPLNTANKHRWQIIGKTMKKPISPIMGSALDMWVVFCQTYKLPGSAIKQVKLDVKVRCLEPHQMSGAKGPYAKKGFSHIVGPQASWDITVYL